MTLEQWNGLFSSITTVVLVMCIICIWYILHKAIQFNKTLNQDYGLPDSCDHSYDPLYGVVTGVMVAGSPVCLKYGIILVREFCEFNPQLDIALKALRHRSTLNPWDISRELQPLFTDLKDSLLVEIKLDLGGRQFLLSFTRKLIFHPDDYVYRLEVNKIN